YSTQYAGNAARSSFDAVAVQADGKVVAGGSATHGNSATDAIVVRLNGSGGPDRSFGHGGVVYMSSAVNFVAIGTFVPGATSLALASRGRIVAAGETQNGASTQAALWALTPRGGPYRAFGSRGKVVTTYRRSASESEAAALAR